MGVVLQGKNGALEDDVLRLSPGVSEAAATFVC